MSKTDNNDVKCINEPTIKQVPLKKKRGRKPKNYVEPVNDEETDSGNGKSPQQTEPVVKKQKKRGRKPKNKFNVDTNFEEYNTLAAANTNHIIKIPINCLEEAETNHTLFENVPPVLEAFNEPTEEKYEYSANCDFYNKEKEFRQSLLELINRYLLDNSTSLNTSLKTTNKLKKGKYISILESVLDDIKNLETFNDYEEYNNDNINSLIPDTKNNFVAFDNNINNNINNHNLVSTELNNDYYKNKKDEIFTELNNTNLSQIEILINKKYRHTKQISLLNDICHNVDNGKWLDKTDILCFWCCHNFDTTPWGLPVKYENNEFTLTGIYCSPNCAMAHLLNIESNNNNLWERIVLLNLLHHKIYETDENIVPAPDKVCLRAFGGPFNIDEYRYLTIENKKNYTITFPPCNIMAPVLEETKKLTNQENYFIPVDMNKVNKINAELKIKRRKTKHHTNSLFNFKSALAH